MKLRRLHSRQPGFDSAFNALLERSADRGEALAQTVAAIIADVRARGDVALLEYTARFDHYTVASAEALEVPKAQRREALEAIPPPLRGALERIAERVRSFAERQRLKGFEFEDADGNRLGERVTALDRVGLYVPGGRAAYPSSVLMNVVPAKVAGVPEVVMCVPAPNGELSRSVLAAAEIGGVDRIFTVGGAQAVAAMACGTQTIPRVDKIVGPGNAYVAAAKRQVFGEVGIDSIAGPSEVLIIADQSAEPSWLAIDLFAQAEHDEDAQTILLSAHPPLLDAVEDAIARLLPQMARSAIIAASLGRHGALIEVMDLGEAAALANRMAPEHLELAVKTPRDLLSQLRHAGALFLGHHAPEAFGDYGIGPNHVLPTSRAARYASPLGAYEFQKRTSLIECSQRGAQRFAETAGVVADAEGLGAHAASARLRG